MFTDGRILCLLAYVWMVGGDDQSHFQHDPRVPLRTIKCLECYETSLTKGSACSRTRYCEGKWCVKGPDSGGMYRGCMHVLPFKEQVARCYNITGEDGKVNENCYCNSDDFCNEAHRVLIDSLVVLFCVSVFLCWLN